MTMDVNLLDGFESSDAQARSMPILLTGERGTAPRLAAAVPIDLTTVLAFWNMRMYQFDAETLAYYTLSADIPANNRNITAVAYNTTATNYVTLTLDGPIADDTVYTLTVSTAMRDIRLTLINPEFITATFVGCAAPIIPDAITVQFIPLSAGGLDGGARLSVISTTGSVHDSGAQMLTTDPLTAPEDWTVGAGWRYDRTKGLSGRAIGGGSPVVTSTQVGASAGVVAAGTATVDITQWQTTDTDSDFGIEWRAEDDRVRLVLRGTGSAAGIYLETEVASTRRVAGFYPLLENYPSGTNVIRLQLTCVNNGATGIVQFIPRKTPLELTTHIIGSQIVCPAVDITNELHLVATARTNGAQVSGRVARVETKPAVLIDSVLAEVSYPTVTSQAVDIIVPSARNLNRLGTRDVTIASYFGEVTVANAFTYLRPYRVISHRGGYARR